MLRRLAPIAVFRGWLLPSGRCVVARTASEYENAVALTTHQERVTTAIYLPLYLDEIDVNALPRGFELGSSPLADCLTREHPSSIMSNAARHVFDFAYGKAGQKQSSE
jgi:hypothetical protein